MATKGAIDELSVAEAIMHELKLKFAKPAGNWRGPAPVEAWDEETRCWTPFCGDDTFMLAVTAALRKVFVRVGFTDAFVDGKLVFKAVALEPDERFGTISGFVGRIAKAARLLLKPQRALDDEEACKHMVHFSCGRTVHFDRPFDEQIQWGRREDRASRCTGKPFVDWSAPDEVKERVRGICNEINKACESKDFSIDDITVEGIEEALASNTKEGNDLKAKAKSIKDGLEEVKKHSDLLKLLHPSHNAWDTTVFELRQLARGASGCSLFEEFLVYLGRRGSNRKTTTLNLLTGLMGSSNREGSIGYICVQKAKYFEGKDTKNAAEPDEGVAAMKGARFILVDEFTGLTNHFNHTLVKTWSDGQGTAIPFERKYGARDEIRPSSSPGCFMVAATRSMGCMPMT